VNVASPEMSPAGTLAFADAGNRAHLSRLARSGRALRLAPGVYALDATLPPPQVAHEHRFRLIAHYWPGAVLCDQTALRGGEPVEGWMFVCHPQPPRAGDVVLPGLTLSVRVGAASLPGDMPAMEGLHFSGPVRTLVENVPGPGRPPRGRPPRAAGVTAVEDRIDSDARIGGAGRIANLLNQLDVVGPSLPAPAVDLVRRRLVALLGTNTPGEATSARLRARLGGQPFDQHRVELFTDFAALLVDTAPSPRSALPSEQAAWLPFFESYFSNYIEGTQFDVDEARRIAIDGVESSSRPQDSHDIRATYRLATHAAHARAVPSSGADLLDLLREQHSILLAARPDKRPGLLKESRNYAGGYAFVDPDLLTGTLVRGFDVFAPVTDAFQRAMALMVLITECHPFDDGNGRVARLLANATLSAAGQVRIVVPTVYRNDYLAGLSSVSSRAGRGEALLSVLGFAQKWTTHVDWRTYEGTHAQLMASHAYVDAGVAERSGQRLRLPS